jgi:diguanylate cyclase (GGDEF)-like protein
MLRRSFRARIIIPTVIVLFILVILLNVFLAVRFSTLSDAHVSEKLVTNANSLKFYLIESMANSRAAAISMAFNSEVIKAIKERDRHEILRLFDQARGLYRINFYTICDNEGTVLARIHSPGEYGDSVLSQQNIQDALSGKIASYFEEGTVVKVSARTGCPVYDADGALVGVISAGIRFDSDNEVKALKKLFNAEVSVFLGNTRIATTLPKDGRNTTSTVLDPQIEEIVLGHKQEYLEKADILGDKYKKIYIPLVNAQNKAFAVFVLGITEADTITTINGSIRDGILIGLGGLIISIVLLFFIISTISKPIVNLTDDMNHIADGNLHIDINIKTDDEIGYLSNSLQRIANTLRKLLHDINIMIIEQKKGNTDYCLNTDDFRGDYKKLANSVLDLAAFGMRDQLTGMPNRRSFDYRLKWEWNRAIRDKSPLSILMLDVDKFKNYNDTLGHQQGDVALQVIAKTIKQTVKRLTEFAARWGGEEFIVLLPTTDSAGAVCVAEKIRAEIENVIIPCSDPRGMKVTISIGVSSQIPTLDISSERTIALADTALYKAKAAGRNKVIFLGEENT